MVSTSDEKQVRVVQVRQRTEKYKTIIIIVLLIIVILILVSNQVSDKNKSFLWFFGFGIATVIIISYLITSRKKEVDIYKISKKIIDKEGEIGVGVTSDNIKNFECFELTPEKFLLYYPGIPLLIGYNISRGITDRLKKNIDNVRESYEKSKLATALILSTRKEAKLRDELEAQGLIQEDEIE